MEKYGFVYIWYDKKHKRFYVGCRWGHENDGYICSSKWMKQAYKHRPNDFKRRILKTNIKTREQTYIEEMHYLQMIKDEEIKIRYYNLNNKNNEVWHKYEEHIKTVGQKISAAKKGKSNGPCSPEKAEKISLAKRVSFMERGGMSEEHKAALTGIKKKPHTEEWKQQNSEKIKEQWATGVRKAKDHITEEHKQKISNKLKGRTLDKSQIEFLKENNSKEYIITYNNGDIITVKGLKKFGIENNIPYVTLNKAFIKQRSINKYNILKIEAA